MSQLTFDTPITKVIKKLIDSSKGKINFANFMSTCMTNENFGYYSSKDLSWDQKGERRLMHFHESLSTYFCNYYRIH